LAGTHRIAALRWSAIKVLRRGSSFHRFDVDGSDPLEQLNCAVLEAIGR
jgi:hypothetical protein